MTSKDLLGWLSYHSKKDVEVMGLKDNYAMMPLSKRRSLVKAFVEAKGDATDVKAALTSSIQMAKVAEQENKSGWITAATAAERLGLKKELYPDLAAFQAAVKAKVDEMHETNAVDPGKRWAESKAGFWASECYFVQDELTSTKFTTNQNQKADILGEGASASTSADVEIKIEPTKPKKFKPKDVSAAISGLLRLCTSTSKNIKDWKVENSESGRLEHEWILEEAELYGLKN